MFTISSMNDFEKLKQERALISFFIDSGYTIETVEAVFRAKRGFDAHVGPRWHMLIPYEERGYKAGYAVDAALDARFYGVGLAQSIIQQQAIPHADLPAILFYEHDRENGYYRISLAGLSDREIVSYIGDIADVVVRAYSECRDDPQEFREDLSIRIQAHDRIKRIIRFARRKASVAINLFGAAGGWR